MFTKLRAPKKFKCDAGCGKVMEIGQSYFREAGSRYCMKCKQGIDKRRKNGK